MNQPLTPTGQSWLTAALDPFHDYVNNVAGLPDDTCSPSYCRVHNQTVTIASTSVGDQFQIMFNGLHGCPRQYVYTTALTTATTIDLGLNRANCAPITIIRSNGHTSPSLASAAAGLNATVVETLPLTPDLSTPSRMIALGLEIHDTTAPIARQGTIAISPSPGAFQTDLGKYLRMNLTDGAQYLYYPHVTLTPALAGYKETAALVPGYLEWEAAKGAYVTGRMISPGKPRHFYAKQSVNNVAMASQLCAGIISEQVGQFDSEGWAVPAGTAVADIANLGTYLTRMTPDFPSGFQPFQVYISGLSATSTFRVVLRTVMEYFPEASDGAVIANAVMATPYDPQALLMYHRARSVLPCAVPVAMNAKGDWWKLVKSAFSVGSKIASGIAPLLGFPMVGKVASIATAASGQLLSQQPPPLPPRPPNNASRSKRQNPKRKKTQSKN